MSPTLQTVQIVLQALSSFAIAGGLIFTAIQFRQARKAQLVANFSKLIELQSQLRYLRVEALENGKSLLTAQQRDQLKNLASSRHPGFRKPQGQSS